MICFSLPRPRRPSTFFNKDSITFPSQCTPCVSITHSKHFFLSSPQLNLVLISCRFTHFLSYLLVCCCSSMNDFYLFHRVWQDIIQLLLREKKTETCLPSVSCDLKVVWFQISIRNYDEKLIY